MMASPVSRHKWEDRTDQLVVFKCTSHVHEDQFLMCKSAWSECRRRHPSLQSRHNFGNQELGIFLKKIMAPIFYFNGTRRLAWTEKEICTKVKNKERGGGVKILALPQPPSPTPTLTVHFNSKSNMASQINDRKLMTLANPNEMPTLQAKGILA